VVSPVQLSGSLGIILEHTVLRVEGGHWRVKDGNQQPRTQQETIFRIHA